MVHQLQPTRIYWTLTLAIARFDAKPATPSEAFQKTIYQQHLDGIDRSRLGCGKGDVVRRQWGFKFHLRVHLLSLLGGWRLPSPA
jgi:hypothetical protein